MTWTRRAFTQTLGAILLGVTCSAPIHFGEDPPQDMLGTVAFANNPTGESGEWVLEVVGQLTGKSVERLDLVAPLGSEGPSFVPYQG